MRVGIDLVLVSDVERSLAAHPGRYLQRVFSPAEIETCTNADGRPVPSRLAARFAAKEAVYKALRPPQGFSYHDVEIVHDPSGAPSVLLSGSAARWAAHCGVVASTVSLTHEGDYASAVYLVMVSPILERRPSHISHTNTTKGPNR